MAALTIQQQIRTLAATYCKWHRKQLFATRKKARQARRLMHVQGINIYPCKVHSGFHIGHLPPVVANGDLTRREVFTRYYGDRDVAS